MKVQLHPQVGKEGEVRALLESAFHAAVEAAQPALALAKLQLEPAKGKTVVVGAGKAASSMAQALEARLIALDWSFEQWPDRSSVVITRYGHLEPSPRPLDPHRPPIRVLEARHPLPDAAGVGATQTLMAALGPLTERDQVICLLSGGGSALLSAPWGVTLEQKIDLTQALLRCGASIGEMNIVRKHLSKVKGGKLAALAFPARVRSLIVSDVVGDDLSSIASGPTAPNRSSFEDALAVLERYRIDAPEAKGHLLRGVGGALREKEVRPHTFERVENELLITNALALGAAKSQFERVGLSAHILSDRVEGEARDAAREHARAARLLTPGQVLLSGGETTVTVRGQGQGGRNLEFLLALALELEGEEGLYALAADTDGIDGVGDAAGAWISPGTLERAAQCGLDARARLEDNDAYHFFSALGDLLITGPTGTNVNDFRCIVRR